MRRVPETGARRQRGFNLVTAIFIITALSFLGLMIVTIGAVQHVTASAAVQGARAYHAARTGAEWAIFRALNVATRNATCGATPATPTTNNFNLTDLGLNGFGVTVVCEYSSHREGPPPEYLVFTITSTASSGTFGDTDFVSRSITVTTTNAPP